jgi:hypothetical protein
MKSHPKVITEQILDLMTAIINDSNTSAPDQGAIQDWSRSKVETWARVKMEWTLTRAMLSQYIEDEESGK